MMTWASGRMHWVRMRKSGKSEELPGFFRWRKGKERLINK